MNRNQTTRIQAQRQLRSQRQSSHDGFTLVEMLVSVTLVLLMMVMFGEMFQLASGSVSRQRIMADNDQNVRTFATVLRADLDKRTMRNVSAFFPGELAANPGTPFGPRRGYFYISNNNNGYNLTPTDHTDDLLQWTIQSTVSIRNSDETPYYGSAAALSGTFLANPNQPDRDDQNIIPNGAGASEAAEVCYFMRGRKLYRRAMLIRKPMQAAGSNLDPQRAAQPSTQAGLDYFNTSTTLPAYAGNLWNEFDYSAHRMPTSLWTFLGSPAGGLNARFNGIDMLSNDQSVLPHSPHPYVYSLGQTWNRFGHNHEIAGPSLAAAIANQNGLSREFGTNQAAPPANAVRFFGRFTHEETSNTAFLYPQVLNIGPPPGINPMDGDVVSSPTNLLTEGEDTNGNGVLDVGEDTNGNGKLDPPDGTINQYGGGGRVGTDLLLAHVHEFQVEVWDQRLGQFVPVGHELSAGGILGDFHSSRNRNGGYAPLAPLGVSVPHALDTWHPNFNRNFNTITYAPNPAEINLLDDQPPYRPLRYDPTSQLTNAVPFQGSGPPTPSTSFPNTPTAQRYWTPGTFYDATLVNFDGTSGNVIFPAVEDINGNGVLDAGEDGLFGFPANVAVNSRPDTRRDEADPAGNGDQTFVVATEDTNGNLQRDRTFPPFEPFGNTLCYRCIRSGTASADPYAEPRWPTTPGQVVRGYEDLNGDGMLNPGEDFNGNNNLDLAPDWICEYNVRPLRAIRITVRFEHPQTKQMRQITIVHSLRDNASVP
ncbi:MAG: type II secretion system protein [Planctomycetia bacterium]|nr:type II secretion system protein [Planctomycetia bacterium]